MPGQWRANGDNDDLPVGRLLTRREVLILFGAGASAVALGACSPEANGTPSGATSAGSGSAAVSSAPAASTLACVVRPEETEGPYWVDEQLNRSDIRSDPSTGAVRGGVPLRLTFVVYKVANGGCRPDQGAQVDIWHCDALGVYSDVSPQNTVGQKYLRGYQVTDTNGEASFTTIYPGWYPSRTVHIHFRIRATSSSGASLNFVSQLFFDDSVSDSVFSKAPYSQHENRDTRNNTDSVYANGGGQLLLTLSQADSGYLATLPIGLQVS